MRPGFFDHYTTDLYVLGPAVASNQSIGFVGPVPAGYCWFVERYTSHVAATAVLELAVLPTPNVPALASWDRGGRVAFHATATDLMSDCSSAIVVPENYHLVAIWSGGTNTNIPILSLQVAVHALTLKEFSVSPLESAQVGTGYAVEHSYAATHPTLEQAPGIPGVEGDRVA